MTRGLFLSLILAVLSGAQAFAGPPIPAPEPVATSAASPAAAALQAYRDNHVSLAVDRARPQAEKGDPDALYLMAFAMESMEPVKLSRGQAMDYYYRRAEAAGHPEAAGRRLLIALCSGIEKERQAAAATLEDESRRGDLRSGRLLGEAILRGLLDGKPDPGKAENQWKATAAAGDAASLVQLARLHEGAFGFPELRDLKAALSFYSEAAERGDASSLTAAGALLLAGDPAMRQPDEGVALLKKAMEAREPRACLLLGDYEMQAKKDEAAANAAYLQGALWGQTECMFRLSQHGESQVREEWLRKAADGGCPDAAAELGHHLFPQDHATGCRYLLAAANDGLPKAQYELGLIYLNGELGYRDATSAVAWLTEAMKSGDAEIQYKLGTLHEQGIGCPVNYANAGVLYTMACNKGHAAAAARVAHLSNEGLGMKRNPFQAWAYATLAVERGDDSAKPLLAELEKQVDPKRPELQTLLSSLREASKKPAWSSDRTKSSNSR